MEGKRRRELSGGKKSEKGGISNMGGEKLTGTGKFSRRDIFLGREKGLAPLHCITLHCTGPLLISFSYWHRNKCAYREERERGYKKKETQWGHPCMTIGPFCSLLLTATRKTGSQPAACSFAERKSRGRVKLSFETGEVYFRVVAYITMTASTSLINLLSSASLTILAKFR